MVRIKLSQVIIFLYVCFGFVVVQADRPLFTGLLSAAKEQTGVEDIFAQRSQSVSSEFAQKLMPFVDDLYKENLLTVAVGSCDKKLQQTVYPSVKTSDKAFSCATTCGYEEAGIELLPKVYDVDKAVAFVDTIQDKKVVFEDPYVKNSMLAGALRSINLVTVLKNRFPTEETKTERLFQKYKIRNFEQLEKYFGKRDVESSLLLHHTYLDDIVSQVADKERIAKFQGRTTFVHAHRWEFNFLSDIWNLIQALKNKDTEISFRPWLRQRDEDTCNIQDLYAMRSKLIKRGAYCGSATKRKEKQQLGQELTCVNRTLFSNLHLPYECSGWYAKNNFSCSVQDLALDYALKLCHEHGLSEHVDKVQELYDLHKDVSDTGELLCINIKDSEIDNMMYVAKCGGAKHRSPCLYQVSENIKHHQQLVETVPDYFDTESCNDKNKVELYCVACLDIPGEYGDTYTIDSIFTGDKEKYQTYKQKLDNLFKILKNK